MNFKVFMGYFLGDEEIIIFDWTLRDCKILKHLEAAQYPEKA